MLIEMLAGAIISEVSRIALRSLSSKIPTLTRKATIKGRLMMMKHRSRISAGITSLCLLGMVMVIHSRFANLAAVTGADLVDAIGAAALLGAVVARLLSDLATDQQRGALEIEPKR